ncbi:Cytoplasmic tRNA 2-thiolation protein 2 [Heterocephalus glaber]|uniref:Cytoplasmic tRNA 2-thiolation protein 2 n=1 Tax=Heterocephalus glaber TaxID=10181 RepID=G5C2U1_HETGA|nr:cytoplasmic tRNA 2-thiolation protein 2 isoform X2 [Heterocephalus glaber]EHB15852.1 Cytoplasmic tRNA 2-thiolation protein 2 [Heterocephalus glaber]
MCQVGEDYVEPPPREPPPVPRPGCGQKCVKCKQGDPVVVIRAGDAFCRDCFKAFYVHKFRAMLGKNRLIFPGEKVLLAWSGGPSSSSMVWQVLEGLSQDSAKRLRFVPGVVYVDEGAACGQSPEDRAKTLAEVKQVLHVVNFPWHLVALEEVFSLPPSVLRCCPQEPAGTEGAYKSAVDSFLQQYHVLGAEGAEDSCGRARGEEERPWPQSQDPHSLPSPAGPPSAAQTEALCRLFESVRTLTAKEELLQTLRSHLILHVARAHGYSKVMTGDSCTRLAIKLMTNLALGRGAFLAWDTGFSDERHGDVVVVRPMRDHTLKEVAFYNRLFAVPLVFTPAVDTKAPEKASVHRLMEAFILRLQAQFPSTVSTVYRTGEKLVKAPRDGCGGGPSGPRCLLCLCTLDIDTADSATAFGAQTSSLSQMPPSTLQAEAGTPTAPCCAVGEGPGCCWKARGRTDDAQAQVTQQLCYGCRGNMSDLPSLDRLPPYILAEAQLRSQRAGVMQEIQEYLIEDSSDEAEGPQS